MSSNSRFDQLFVSMFKMKATSKFDCEKFGLTSGIFLTKPFVEENYQKSS